MGTRVPIRGGIIGDMEPLHGGAVMVVFKHCVFNPDGPTELTFSEIQQRVHPTPDTGALRQTVDQLVLHRLLVAKKGECGALVYSLPPNKPPPFPEGSVPDRLGKALQKLGAKIDMFHLTRRPITGDPTVNTPCDPPVYEMAVYRVPIESKEHGYVGLVDPEKLLPEVEKCATVEEAVRVIQKLSGWD